MIVTLMAVLLCILIHYEILAVSARWLLRSSMRSARTTVMLGTIIALFSHFMQILLFALVYWLQVNVLDDATIMHLTANTNTPVTNLVDCIYFSFVTYTTLGFGDMIPYGWIRFTVGTEAIIGLIMIAWTASFCFLELQKKHDDLAEQCP